MRRAHASLCAHAGAHACVRVCVCVCARMYVYVCVQARLRTLLRVHPWGTDNRARTATSSMDSELAAWVARARDPLVASSARISHV